MTDTPVRSLRAGHRGFSMVFAVAVLGLMGMALSAVATRIVLQQRRTVDAVEEAQAAALLAAGVHAAEGQAADAASVPVDGPLPTPAGTLRLAWSGTPAARVCVVEAAFGHARRGASVRFDHARAVAVGP